MTGIVLHEHPCHGLLVQGLALHERTTLSHVVHARKWTRAAAARTNAHNACLHLNNRSMAFDGRRTLLSSIDTNTYNGHAAPSSMKKSASHARQSMIPRHSVAPARAQEGVGSSRQSFAPYNSAGHQTTSGGNGMDIDSWGLHPINNTPHHPHAFAHGRRTESIGGHARQSMSAARMSVAPTPRYVGVTNRYRMLTAPKLPKIDGKTLASATCGNEL